MTRQTEKHPSNLRALDIVQRRDRDNVDQVEETYEAQNRDTDSPGLWAL